MGVKNQTVTNEMMPLDQCRLIDAKALNHASKLQNNFETKSSILDRLLNFASVPDFRRTSKGNIRHKLRDVIMLLILGRVSGCIELADIIEFGKHNLNKMRKLGLLRHGVPSEATLWRVENGINEQDMADTMQQFIALFHRELCQFIKGKEIICIDGKAERTRLFHLRLLLSAKTYLIK